MHWPYVLPNPSTTLMANDPYNIVFNQPNSNAQTMLAALMAISQTSPYCILMIILIPIWLFNTAKPTTVGQLVITLTYTVSHPIRPTTPLLANWSSFQHTLLATPSAPPPTVSWLVITPTYPISCPISPTPPLSADWSSFQHTPSATPSPPPSHCQPTWLSPQHTLSTAPSATLPHCWLTGHHSNIPRWPPHQPHHPTVSQLVFTWTHHSNIPCRPPH